MALVHRDTPSPETRVRGDLGQLVAALAAPEAADRQRAVLDLRGEPAAVPALLARVGEESDVAVLQAMLTALAGHGTVEVARSLIGHLGSDDAGLRTAVARTLATMPAAVMPLVPGLVTDDNPDVRIMTALVLTDLPAPDSARWLVRMLTGDGHPNVVAAAVDALLPLAGPEHVEPLRQVLDRFPDDPFLRFTISAALPRLTGVTA